MFAQASFLLPALTPVDIKFCSCFSFEDACLDFPAADPVELFFPGRGGLY